jgi:hypothetical protein
MNNGTVTVQRYIPLLCWVIVVLTALAICSKILGYGFLPAGDARRHVARVFANKPYSDIVVLRPEYKIDHSPGWEWLLGQAHRAFGWDEDALISFSVASMILWFFCLPLIWLRRPEAWLAAILAQMIAIPELMARLTQGRPFILTEGILVALLFSWSKEEGKNPPWWKVVLTVGGFALSVWMHGAWYLWVLLPTAFLLAQRWRAACWLLGCGAAGVLIGALLTGHPLAFLNESIFIARTIRQEHAPQWLLVGEFQPGAGEFATLTLLALVFLWRKLQNKPIRPLYLQPVAWMIVINWMAGFVADRFWADWGMPAAVVWLAMQFEEGMPDLSPFDSPRRLLFCGLIALPLFLDASNDLGRRYSFSLDEVFLNGSDPKLAGWMPGKNGIFYAGSMRFFYNTFYKNPQADWRYMVGFEPALMPPGMLKAYRDIQRSGGSAAAYEPWVKKMRPQDRLAIESPSQPALPALEWKLAAGDIWIGRVPPAAGVKH